MTAFADVALRHGQLSNQQPFQVEQLVDLKLYLEDKVVVVFLGVSFFRLLSNELVPPDCLVALALLVVFAVAHLQQFQQLEVNSLPFEQLRL